MKKILLSLMLLISITAQGATKYFEDLVKVTNKTVQQTFEEVVLSSTKLVVVDFYADWCGACNRLSPTFDKIASDSRYKDIMFIKVNYDTFKDLAKMQRVKSLPTIYFFKDGQKIETSVGVKSEKELRTLLDKHLN